MPKDMKKRYNGKILRSKVDSTDNGYWQFIVVVQLLELWNPDKNAAEKLEKPRLETAYLMLSGEKGVNETQLEAIQGFAHEWTDTDDLGQLHKLNLAGRDVQIVTEMNEYKGKVTERIGFINAPGGLRATPKNVIEAMGKGWKTSKAPVTPKTTNATQAGSAEEV